MDKKIDEFNRLMNCDHGRCFRLYDRNSDIREAAE